MKSVASLSLDLDNEWAYLMTHGNETWRSYPSYLNVVVPRVLGVLDRLGLRISFFVVGTDAARRENQDAIRSLAAAGHEIGNHSYRHQPWLHLYSKQEIRDELARTEDILGEVTGQRTVGFRGPGYSLSPDVLDVLVERGYRYDASTLPTFIGPVSRAFYFRSAKLTDEQRAERSLLFGSWKEGLRPLDPYRWKTNNGGSMLEIPVSVLPGGRVPIHISYLLYLAAVQPAAARTYFATALRICKASGHEPSILLHPLDFLGADDVGTLSFFPAMGMGGVAKTKLVESFLQQLSSAFTVLSMEQHARHIERNAAQAGQQLNTKTLDPIVVPNGTKPTFAELSDADQSEEILV
jgi:peptidoglycan-N-acetylglucosamine deacetylase